MISVLLIEDEAPVARMMSIFLIEAGFQVGRVTRPEAAIDRLRDYRPDVIVFNTIMPASIRNRAIAEMRVFAPGVRVIDVSEEKSQLHAGLVGAPPDRASLDGASMDGASRDGAPTNGASADGASPRGDESGADAYLRLPFEATGLIEAVRRLAALQPARE